MRTLLFFATVGCAALLVAISGLKVQVPAAGKAAWPAAVAQPVAPGSFGTDAKVPSRKLNFPPVGTVTVYGNMTTPAEVVLFISGDGGWNLGVVDMAKALAQDGQTLVVGIDIVKYYKKLQSTDEKCLYPAGDMENLSEFVQKELKLPVYHKPVLAGYSSGATLSYGLLCQAPAGTFKGGVALGFCPDIQVRKPLCEGSGKLTMVRRKDGLGFDFTDQPAPAAPLEVLQGEVDQDCHCQKTLDFFENVPNVTVTRLPKVGHGFAVTKNWLPQFRASFARVAPAVKSDGAVRHQTSANSLSVLATLSDAVAATGAGLPVTITPAPSDSNTPLVLFISGDGGWTGFDQQICDQLSAKHLPVVGLNSQSYFWKAKSPEQTTNDLAPLLRQYLAQWGKSKFLLLGYSFGANVAPFVYNRLPADLREKAEGVVLLSPDVKGDFEIHVAGMLGWGGGAYDVAAEVRRMQGVPVLCVSGEKEDNAFKQALQGAAHTRFVKIPGSHHYDNDAVKVAGTIWSK